MVIPFHYLTLLIYFGFMKNSRKFQNILNTSLRRRTKIPDVPKNKIRFLICYILKFRVYLYIKYIRNKRD